MPPLALEYHRESTNRLLSYPPGTYTPETFFEAESLLEGWCRLRTAESAIVSFQLLDRVLLVEEGHSFVRSDLLNAALNNWRVVWWQIDLGGEKKELDDGGSAKYGGQELISKRMKEDRLAFLHEEDAASEHDGGEEDDGWSEGSVRRRPLERGWSEEEREQSISTLCDSDDESLEYVARKLTPQNMWERLLSYLGVGDNTETGAPRARAASATAPPVVVVVNEKSLHLVVEAAVANNKDPSEASRLAQTVLATALELVSAAAPDAGDTSVTADGEMFPNHMHVGLLPSTLLCNNILRARTTAVTTREDAADAARYCEFVMARMNALHIPVDRITYHHLIRAHTATRSLEGALSATQVLRRMLDERRQGDRGVEPSYVTYASVVSAWAQSGSRDAGKHGEELLEEMRWSDSPLLRRQVNVFNEVLRCHTGLRSREGALRAAELLRQQHKSDHPPNYESHLIVMLGLAEMGYALEAEAILNLVPTERRDAALYTAVISAWARGSHRKAAERAKDILDRMKALGRKNKHVLPTIYTYNSLLHCFAKSKGPGFMASEASKLFDEMLERGIQPNAVTHTALLKSYAQFGLVDGALAALQRIPNPDLRAYNTVLSAFIRSKDPHAANMALKILRSMPEHGIEPDLYSYNTVISAFGNSKAKDRLKNSRAAHDLLNEMRKRYRETGDARIRPSRVSYNAVINAYAKSHEPEKAERLLAEMFEDYLSGWNPSARPDVTSFNAVLKAIAFGAGKNCNEGKDDHLEEKAQELFSRMESLAPDNPEWAPNVVTYTTLVLCHGLSGNPRQAESVLRDMLVKHKRGELSEGPNETTFRTLRKAWSSSRESDKEEHAERIRREMADRFGT
jgi:pentatricopeptide repeat protein